MTQTPKKKLLITNVVYGSMYANIFLNFHLKSLLDETNLPQMKDRVEYGIYTDAETLKLLSGHPNFLLLQKYVQVYTWEFGWSGIENRFDRRYTVLSTTFQLGLEVALEKNYYSAAWVADLVVAKHFLPKLFEKVDAGFDSVFVLPMRTAFEPMSGPLASNVGAMFSQDLFELGYKNLHPLWVACHWNAAQFSKLPYSLVWNSGTGLLVHSFSHTPIIFTPYEEMRQTKNVIDVEIPSMCKNPYWAEEWTEAPVMGVEPLFCYYPPFDNGVASVDRVGSWAARTLNPVQVPFLTPRLFFPDRQTVGFSATELGAQDELVKEILTEYSKKKERMPECN